MWALAKRVLAYDSARPDRIIRLLFVSTVVLFFGSCSVSFYVITAAQADIPYGEDSQPSLYVVLHKDDAGQWGLAVLNGAGSYPNPTISELPVLDWPEVESVESFVVGPEDMDRIDRLIGTHTRSRVTLYKMELSSSAHEPDRQEVAIKTGWGDNSRFYRYVVDSERGEVIPLAYGMLEKRQGALAIMIAFIVTLAVWSVGIVLYTVTALRRRLLQRSGRDTAAFPEP